MSINRHRARRKKAWQDSAGGVVDAAGVCLKYARPLLKTGLILLTLGGIAFGAWSAILTSPYFMVRNISIQTIPQMTDAEVLERVGLAEQGNIFVFNSAQGQVNLLSHPWVAQATVETTLPDRVEIRLKAREPIGVLVMKRMFFVDAEGRPFIEAKASECRGLPMVTGITSADFDDDAQSAQARIRQALDIAGQYAALPMANYWSLGTIVVGDGGRINLMLGQTRVGLGSHKFSVKLKRLNQIFASLRKRKVGAEYILFGDDPRRVTVRESVLVGVERTISLNAAGARK
mgnify:CR=1 FL=1